MRWFEKTQDFTFISNYRSRKILPALGQGVIALVVKSSHKEIKKIVKQLNHEKTFIEIDCERIFLKALDGSCKTPVGGYAR